MRLNWNFQGGWGDSNQKAFRGKSMDIFWNSTIYLSSRYNSMRTKKIYSLSTIFLELTFNRNIDRAVSKLN